MDRRITVKLPRETVKKVRQRKAQEETKDGKGKITFTSYLDSLVLIGLEEALNGRR